ncbi:MMPL family transporter, partial [Candidatus Sumerlaeota bacterium]|nr:MMPL family transporter [Candidatus Sumerlaeota bacterium]
FVVMPAAMMLFTKPEKTPPPEGSADHSNMFPLAEFTGKHPIIVGIVSLILLLFFCVGVLRISVEARFIDYFRKSTPIYQSITMLDEKMGGAMPLEVVLEGEGKDYWLEPANLETLGKVHKFIENLPETAKVISGETMREILQKVNKGNPVSKTIFNMARNALPKEYYRYIIEPYMTPDFDQARIMIRVHDSDPKLNRTELRRKIEDFLNNEMKLKVGEKSHITGYFILYNNMLQSLYTSQINTVGSVFITVWVMFFILFRSFKLALIGLVPNVIAVCTILGTMGWLGIHLDMMTVMIAAITFGMADDNTIHYIHRFQHEFPKDRSYVATMYRCHDTIGRPLSYTMLTTVAGFAILVLSNFIPTAYFGLFTGLAMFVALMATHTILPMMIITLKPFGRETPASAKPE